MANIKKPDEITAKRYTIRLPELWLKFIQQSDINLSHDTRELLKEKYSSEFVEWLRDNDLEEWVNKAKEYNVELVND